MNATKRGQAGYSLIELMVTVTMIGIVAGIAISHVRPSGYELDAAAARLVADVRLTRASATSRGVHYRLVVNDAATTAIERMREAAHGTWNRDASDVRTTSLPKTVRLATAPGTALEFDTRGRLVGQKQPVSLDLRASTGGARRLTVWPSGQVVRN